MIINFDVFAVYGMIAAKKKSLCNHEVFRCFYNARTGTIAIQLGLSTSSSIFHSLKIMHGKCKWMKDCYCFLLSFRRPDASNKSSCVVNFKLYLFPVTSFTGAPRASTRDASSVPVKWLLIAD